MLQYAPKQQLLISGGRKGCVCIFDIRQRQLIHTFQAHDSAIKALALDPCEEYFTTGSAEGNIKVSQYKRLECAKYCLYLLSRLIGEGEPNQKTHRPLRANIASSLTSVWFFLNC